MQHCLAGGALSRFRYIILFYAIACGFAWIVWLPLILGPLGLKVIRASVSFPVSHMHRHSGPGDCLLYQSSHRDGKLAGCSRFPAIGSAEPMAIGWSAGDSLLPSFSLRRSHHKGGPAAWHWHPGVLVGILIPMFNYNLFGGPLFEEFGWRGYLQSHLQQMFPPWIAAIAVGISVGSVAPAPVSCRIGRRFGNLSFTVILIGVSLIMAFAFNASGEAVLVAILMHSAFNASNRFVPGFLADVPLVEWPSEVALIAISFLAVALVATALSRGRLCARIGTNK